MTAFEIASAAFTRDTVKVWASERPQYRNWPVVYVLDGKDRSDRLIYVGETLSATTRMNQHLDSESKRRLTSIRVVIDPTFNKSVCLDLESYLIQAFSGDGSCTVMNRNAGIVDADYYDRDRYQRQFQEVFDRLLAEGLFSRSYSEIVNSDLFKLSPFKALTPDQAVAVEDILEGYFEDRQTEASSTIVVQGAPGTGKTVVAIYLLKLLVDIGKGLPPDEHDIDSVFSELFLDENRDMVDPQRIALVIPQQSLRKSVRKVFKNTPGLDPSMVLDPFELAKSERDYDLVIVDEAHRLNQRANQSSGVRNRDFMDINAKLFGSDDPSHTQLDWIEAKSAHRILMVDGGQSVRPADLPLQLLKSVTSKAEADGRHYRLMSQMRVRAGFDYVGYVRAVLEAGGERHAPTPTMPEQLGEYDLRMFDDLGELRREIHRRDAEVGLARMVAGYAWEWRSKTDKLAFDIEVGDVRLRWNGTDTDWIASPGSLEEVGSIHTVQGYDLNYAGVIIGPDLRFDKATGRIRVDRASYFDKKGQENNKTLGISYDDEDLLRFIVNIYVVLLTRGIRGTYVYVSDPALREHLRPYFDALVSTS